MLILSLSLNNSWLINNNNWLFLGSTDLFPLITWWLHLMLSSLNWWITTCSTSPPQDFAVAGQWAPLQLPGLHSAENYISEVSLLHLGSLESFSVAVLRTGISLGFTCPVKSLPPHKSDLCEFIILYKELLKLFHLIGCLRSHTLSVQLSVALSGYELLFCSGNVIPRTLLECLL